MAYFGKMGSRENRRTVPESHPLYVVNRSAAVRPRGRDEQLRADRYDQGPQGTPLIDDARRYDPSLSGGCVNVFGKSSPAERSLTVAAL